MDKGNQILKLIEENPGIYVREIVKNTGFANGVAQYHLGKLEKSGKIKADKRTRYKRFYSADVNEEEFPIIANLRKKTKQKVLFAILNSTDPCFDEVLQKIHKSPSTISWNIAGLVDDGVLEKVTKNGKKVYRVKNKKLLRRTLEKEFSKLFKNSFEHDEDVFLSF